MPTSKLTEAEVTLQIKGYIEARGWYAIRLQSGTVRGVTRGTFITLGKKGLPDWVFVRKWAGYPIHLFVEMKAPCKKLAPDQVDWFNDANYRGLWAIWADSLEMFIEKYEKEMPK